MDQAIELATLTGNLEPAEDEEDIENEDEVLLYIHEVVTQPTILNRTILSNIIHMT